MKTTIHPAERRHSAQGKSLTNVSRLPQNTGIIHHSYKQGSEEVFADIAQNNIPNAMKKYIAWFFISVILLIPFSSCAEPIERPAAWKIRFDRLNTENGLSQNGVRAILQDRRGFLWFGTYDGLNRYDGYAFKIYRSKPGEPNSLSQKTIFSLLEDRDGMIWIGTAGGLDRFDPTTETFTHYRHDPANPNSLSENLALSLHQDRDGMIWIGTVGEGVNRLNPKTGALTRYKHDESQPDSISAGVVWHVGEDRSGTLWLGTSGGLNRVDPKTGEATRYLSNPEKPDVRIFHEDAAGNFWVGGQDGLQLFDQQTGQFRREYRVANDLEAARNSYVSNLYEDVNGGLWITSHSSAMHRLDLPSGVLVAYQNDPSDSYSLSNTNLWTVAGDREGNVWFGGEISGVNRCNARPPQFRAYPILMPNSESAQAAVIFESPQGDLLVGAYRLLRLDEETGEYAPVPSLPEQAFSQGVMQADGAFWWTEAGTGNVGLFRYDPATQAITTYKHDPANPSSLSHDGVFSIFKDRANHIWIGTDRGLDRYNPAIDGFDHFTPLPDEPESSNNNIGAIYEDRDGLLWLGSWYSGLFRFDPNTAQFVHYAPDAETRGKLAGNAALTIHQDQQGAIWVGTSSALERYDAATDSFTQYTEYDGLPSSAIRCITEDDQQRLWISTLNGLARFNPEDHTFNSYNRSNGLLADQFVHHACYRSQRGDLYFGTVAGLMAFDPKKIADNPYRPPVMLTEMRLANKPELPGRESKLMNAIEVTTALTLAPEDNMVSFDFAALSYVSPKHNRYRYMLEGFDNTWNSVGSNRRSATYTNLPAGRYTFRVNGTNNDGIWSESDAALALTVLPQFWETLPFRIGLLVATAAVLAFGYSYRMQSLHLRQQELEALVKTRTHDLADSNAQLQEATRQANAANHAKSAFLANMSHELRTPLNAVLGFAELLTHTPEMPPQTQEPLATIQRSGEHLLTLINQVLDLSKIEAGRITLDETDVDLHSLLDELHGLFNMRAKQKGLRLHFECAADVPKFIITDEVKLRQVLINLLNNALKFTKTGGVTVRVTNTSQVLETCEVCLHFEIEDTGAGVAPEEMEKLFEPFAQTETGRRAQEGTGLGLPISRRFAQLMGGDLTAQSEPGRGSVFQFDIHAKTSQLTDSVVPEIIKHAIALEPGQPLYRMVIADDNPDNRRLLANLLAPFGFELQEAANGEEAIELWRSWQPHLFWMDLRMPVINGYQAAQTIKSAPNGRETLVIVLSASILDEDRIKVIAAGCDAFLRKPFREHQIIDLLATHLGLRFIYEEDAPTVSTSSEQAEEEIARIPAEMLAKLCESAQINDFTSMTDLIHELRSTFPAAAELFAAFAHDFEYTEILASIRRIRPELEGSK